MPPLPVVVTPRRVHSCGAASRLVVHQMSYTRLLVVGPVCKLTTSPPEAPEMAFSKNEAMSLGLVSAMYSSRLL